MAGKRSRNPATRRQAALQWLPAGNGPDLSRILSPDYCLTPPLISLLSANLFTIALAIALNWQAGPVVFVYWVQSLIIGIFTILSIIGADPLAIRADIEARYRDQNDDTAIDLRRVRTQQYLLAAFFFVHYGIFHLAYYDFITTSGMFGDIPVTDPALWLSCGVFFANHLYSFLYYRKRERRGEEYVNDTFIGPYFRVIPMHLTILFGSSVILALGVLGIESTMPVLVVFLLLKTAADTAMHAWKHPREV